MNDLSRDTAGTVSENENTPQETAPTSGGTGTAPLPGTLSGLGVCSVLCGLFSFIFPLPAFFGIGMALYGIRRNRKDILCYIGLCLSAAMLAYSLTSLVQLCGSPEMDALLSSAATDGGM